MAPSRPHLFCALLLVSSTCTCPVPTCLDCFFQFLEEMRDAIFVRRKRTRYHVSVSWIMTTQALSSIPIKDHTVVKIIVSLQNSPITISKQLLKMPNLSCLFIFCLLQAISLLYTITFRGIFFFSSYFPLRRNLSEKASPRLSQQEFSHQEQAFIALWGNIF